MSSTATIDPPETTTRELLADVTAFNDAKALADSGAELIGTALDRVGDSDDPACGFPLFAWIPSGSVKSDRGIYTPVADVKLRIEEVNCEVGPVRAFADRLRKIADAIDPVPGRSVGFGVVNGERL